MDQLRIDSQYLIEKTQQLLRFPSVNPPGDVRDIARALEMDIRALGMAVETVAEDPLKPNLIARWTGPASRPRLVMYAHTDVVPVEPGERTRWLCDPFAAEMREGVLYGRGAVDAKSKVAAMLAATKAVRDSGLSLRGELCMLFVADGEIGDRAGLRYLGDRVPDVLSADVAIGCEPSELKIIRVYKGRLWLHVTVKGASAHSIVPASGINAIEKMLTILPALLATPSSAPEQVDGALREEMLGAVTRTYTTIHGGTAPNVAPGSSEATLDFRLVPGQTVNGLLSDLQVQTDRLRAAHPGTLIDIEPIPGSPRDPVVIPRDAPVIQALQRAYLQATGQPAAFGRGYSSGGLYHFHRLGIPAVYFGSGSIDLAHRENELVTLQELTLMAKLYAHLILDVCGPQAREQS